MRIWFNAVSKMYICKKTLMLFLLKLEMCFSFIYLNFEDILSNCEIPSFVWCIFMAHFQCICVQQNFLLMKIKSLFLSRGKILNKMMFNAFKERDTILKENIFVIFCLLTIGRFLLSIEPLELYFSFVNGKMKRLLKRCHFLWLEMICYWAIIQIHSWG